MDFPSAVREHLVRERLRHDDHRRLQAIAERGLLDFLRLEIAPGDQCRAERVHRLLIDQIERALRRRGLLLGLKTETAAPAALAHRHGIRTGRRGDAGQLAQHCKIGLLHGLRIEALAEAGAAEPERIGLVDAAGPMHALEALSDDEQRVADDRERQRNLQADQDHRDLAAHQCGNDGTDFHGFCPGMGNRE